MAFTDNDIIKLAGNVLASGTLDSSGSNWYETRNPNSFIVDPESIWSDLPLMKNFHASNFTQAVAHAVANPEYFELIGINDDGSFNDNTAIRLTPVAGTNNATYIAYNEFNSPTSGVRKNWILPHLIPRPNGAPSNAYQATIWNGPPSNGNKILTSTGNDGTWVSHFWNSAGGLLLISPNDAPPSSSFPSTDLWVTGIGYAGATSGGGGVEGNTITLQDEESTWRITTDDSAHMHFERFDEKPDGTFEWNTKFKIGGSAVTDNLVLTQPHGINVDLTPSNLNDDLEPDLHSMFAVSGTDKKFLFGNSDHQTVIETEKGYEVKRADTILQEQEFENRPLFDVEQVMDGTDTPEVGSVRELSWISDISYGVDADFIRFNELAFEVLETTDGADPVDEVPFRIAVEDLDGNLIQENLSYAGLEAGINGNFNFKVGYNFYKVTPKYQDTQSARTRTRITIAKGYKVKLTGGMYRTFDHTTSQFVDQYVPRQKAKIEYVDHVNMLDESNFRREIWKNSNTVIDNGVGVWYPFENDFEYTQLVAPSEHTTTNEAVLGNYNDRTYVASGQGGLHILYQDDSTRTEFWSEGDTQRINVGGVPTSYIETDRLTFSLNGIFESELNKLNWNVVNVEKIIPLIRYEGDEDFSYRVVIESEVPPVGLTKLQENMTKNEFLDGKYDSNYGLRPTLNPNSPVYEDMFLPRKSFTVNRETPRRVDITFQKPVKVYGYYDNGVFVPSIKAQVVQVIESPIVTGDDLEERVDEIQGQQEWAYAVENDWPTLHEVPSEMWITDEDGEELFWSDLEALYEDTDEHQWLYTSGTEAYYTPAEIQGVFSELGTIFTPNPLVVHVPNDTVKHFDVTLAWHNELRVNAVVEYAPMEFYIATHGRGYDQRISINLPRNASIRYRFTTRRDGKYSYSATPYNDGLASTEITGDLTGSYPEDPNPPVGL